MTKKKLKVALDIDGVIMDFLSQLLRVHNIRSKEGPRVTVEDLTVFMPDGDLSDLMTEEQWNDSFEYFEANGGYATLKSFEGVRTALERIIEDGHDLIFITARHSKFAGETEMSFILNGLPLRKIYYAPRGKGPVLKRLKPDVFVDDSLKHVKSAQKVGISNIYVMDAPYNKTEENVKRIYNLIQLERDILNV